MNPSSFLTLYRNKGRSSHARNDFNVSSFQSSTLKFPTGGAQVLRVEGSKRRQKSILIRQSLRTFFAYRSNCRGLCVRSEAADGVGFGVVDAENGQQPGQLQHVVELVAQIGQVQGGALLVRADVRCY